MRLTLLANRSAITVALSKFEALALAEALRERAELSAAELPTFTMYLDGDGD